MENQSSVSKYAPYIRLVVMVISLLATGATTMFGWNPFPFTNEEITQWLTMALSIGLAVYNWFKDQPVTTYGKAKVEAGVQAVGTRKEFNEQNKG